MRTITRQYPWLARPIGLVVVAALIVLISGNGQSGYAQPKKSENNTPSKKTEPTKEGVSINDPKAFKGYTLFGSMLSNSTYLIDQEGRVVRTWESEYKPALGSQLLENGHMMRQTVVDVNIAMTPGSGGRFQEFDWDGKLVWDFTFPNGDKFHPHHDFTQLPNGNFLIIASEPKTKQQVLDAGRRPDLVLHSLWPDAIYEVKPAGKTTGEIIWEWHVWDHLVQHHDKTKANYGRISEHPELIDLNFGDLMWSDKAGKNNSGLFDRLRSLGYVGGSSSKGPSGTKGPEGGKGSKGADGYKGSKGGEGYKGSKGSDGPKGSKGAEGSKGPKGGPEGSKGSGGPEGSGGSHVMDPEWTHINSVAYNAELDQIVMSVHSFHEIWIIDHSTTKKEAASHEGGRQGKGGDLLYRWGNPRAYKMGINTDQRFSYQHCAYWIPKGYPGEGHILVFNNGTNRPDGEYSSVDEIVTPVQKDGGYASTPGVHFGPDKPVWSYTAPNKTDFYSLVVSGAQRLPNGNTLICYGTEGSLFEVTPEKEVVWKFTVPEGASSYFEMFPPPLQGHLKVTNAQKKQLEELQADVDSALNKLLTDEQKQRLNGTGAKQITPGNPGFSQNGGLFRGTRYGADYLGFKGKDLKPGKKLE